MSSVEHVLSGAGAPTDAPPSVAAHYVDTDTGRHYISTGTSSPEDWQPQLRVYLSNGQPPSPTGPAMGFDSTYPGKVWVSRFYLDPNDNPYWEWVELPLS